jgi:hypothetical protein
MGDTFRIFRIPSSPDGREGFVVLQYTRSGRMSEHTVFDGKRRDLPGFQNLQVWVLRA